MPTLDWIGKDAVVNHHNEIPYHLLHCNPELSVMDIQEEHPLLVFLIGLACRSFSGCVVLGHSRIPNAKTTS